MTLLVGFVDVVFLVQKSLASASGSSGARAARGGPEPEGALSSRDDYPALLISQNNDARARVWPSHAYPPIRNASSRRRHTTTQVSLLRPLLTSALRDGTFDNLRHGRLAHEGGALVELVGHLLALRHDLARLRAAHAFVAKERRLALLYREI